MHKLGESMPSAANTILPKPKTTLIEKTQPELLDGSQNNSGLATLTAMNSLTESTRHLINRMKVTNDAKDLCALANSIAQTVQVQVNVVKLARELTGK